MKKFIQKIQSLGQRAAGLKEAVQSVPTRVAGIRQAVALTAGQLKELGIQVQNSIAGLRADQEDDLLNALREVNDSTGILRQAGFDLGGIDLELSPIQRLIVHLTRREDVRTSVLEALRDASIARPTIHALLASLVRAEETADSVHMTDLNYHTLIVHIGPMPTVRLCWRPAPSLAQAAAASLLEVPATTSPPAAGERPTFFGANPPTTGGFTTAEPAADKDQNAPVPPTPAPSKPEPKPAPSSPARSASSTAPAAPTPREVTAKQDAPPVWNSDALQRFKTMPKASKYRR